MTAIIDNPVHSTTPIPASLATIDEYTRLNLGGYDWMVLNFLGRKQLHASGDNPLTGCEIYEQPADGKGPMFGAVFHHEELPSLSAYSGLVASLAEAIQWATEFQWATRKAGSLTWLAGSPGATRWYTRIGASEAQIFRFDSGDKYTVSRSIRLGNQLIKFEIDDASIGSERRVITTFEQASAIALTMTDYALELMRNVEHGENP